MERYYIKSPFDIRLLLATRVKNETINLLGKSIEQVIPASSTSPERKVFLRGATQGDLEYLHEVDEGNYSRIIGKRTDAEIEAYEEFEEQKFLAENS